mgnify:CR=1 FL=1
MSNIVAFPIGLLKKAEKIRLERSREEKIENKKSNTDSSTSRVREPRLSDPNHTTWIFRNDEEEEA